MDEINERVADVLRQAVLGDANALLTQVDVEDGLLQNRALLRFFLAEDWNPAGPKHRIIKPHQLHFRQICSRETGWLRSRVYTQPTAATELSRTTLNTWYFKISAPRTYILLGITSMPSFTPAARQVINRTGVNHPATPAPNGHVSPAFA